MSLSSNGSSETQQILIRAHDSWALDRDCGREREVNLFPELEGSDLEVSGKINEHK